MGRTFLAWSMVAVSFLAACGGDDFTSEGGSGGAAGSSDAGSDAAATGGAAGASTGGAAGSGGSAGAVSGCDTPFPGNDCNEVSTGSPTCDTCGRANCCAQVNDCLADADCRRLLACFVSSCKNQEPISCGASACNQCLQQLGKFTAVSSCLQTHCNAECPFKAG